MRKRIKTLSRTEKLMAVLIIMLLVGICLRWSYIRREAGEAVRSRIESIREMRTERRPEAAEADSAARQR